MASRSQIAQHWPLDEVARLAGGGSGYRVAELTCLGICNLQARKGRQAALEAAARDAGIPLPDGARSLKSGGITAVGTGPGAWLLLEDQAQFALCPRLRERLGEWATVVEVSDAYAMLTISGARVRDILAKGVTLDIADEIFRPGDAAVTKVAHVTVTMWRLDDDPEQGATFILAAPRSYASAFLHWLGESTAEFRSGA